MDYGLERKGWYPAAADFAEGIAHVSNYPLAYVYAMFQALSGHIIGRRAFIRYATPLYPNSYVCLVGPSGLAHKSTAIALSLESLGELIDEMPPVRSATTSQGLLAAMLSGGGMLLLVLDELASLLSKKRQDFAADLLARIVELYACPRTAGNYTRYDPIEVTQTFMTIISGSTIEWLQASLTTGDLMAGFGNRMTFVLGDPRQDNPWPKRPILDSLDWERITEFQGEVTLDETARDMWDGFYRDFVDRQKAANPFTRVLAERIPEKVLKASVVTSAWYNSSIVEADFLEGAIDWGDYLYESVLKLVPAFEHVESQIIAAIKDGKTTRPQVFGTLAHSIAPERLKKGIETLKWLGMIEEKHASGFRIKKEV